MSKNFRCFVITLLCLFILPVFSHTAAAASYDVNVVGVPVTFEQDSARNMLNMINSFRTGSDAWAYDQSGRRVSYSGLGTLTYDYGLEEKAMQRAAEIAVLFSHTRPWPRMSIWSNAYGYYQGENIAAGYGSAASVFAGWQETNETYEYQGHRRNMLDSGFRSIGIGHAIVDGVDFWVQEFASNIVDTVPREITAEQTRTVYILSSLITYARLYFGSDIPSRMEMGSQADLPEVYAQIQVTLDSDNMTWGAVRVIPGATVTSSNENVLALQDGKLIAKTPGAATITASQMNTTVTASVTVTKYQISRADISLDEPAYTYDGSAKEPAVTVRYGASTLTRGTDYDVSYTDNTNAGTARVTVTGKGSYEGTAGRTFTIRPLSIAGASFSVPDQIYTGKALTPAPENVSLSGTPLALNRDFAVSYEKNVNAGTASVTLTGKGNYTGSVSGTFTIQPAAISGCTISVADQTYTGKALKPVLTVKSGTGKTLKSGTDYRASYSNNTKVGTASVTLTGIGNYTGTAKATFAIKAAKDASKVIAARRLGSSTSLVAAGKKITGEKDASGSTFSLLQLTYGRVTANSIQLTWKKVTGASTYIVMGSACTTRYSRLGQTKARAFTQKRLKKGTYYKYYVMAVNSSGQVIAISKSVHVATGGGKAGNYRKVGTNRTALSLSVKKSFALKASQKVVSAKQKVKQHRKVAFESSDGNIATVSASGKVTAVSKGTCYVYAYSQDGHFARVKVTVK